MLFSIQIFDSAFSSLKLLVDSFWLAEMLWTWFHTPVLIVYYIDHLMPVRLWSDYQVLNIKLNFRQVLIINLTYTSYLFINISIGFKNSLRNSYEDAPTIWPKHSKCRKQKIFLLLFHMLSLLKCWGVGQFND